MKQLLFCIIFAFSTTPVIAQSINTSFDEVLRKALAEVGTETGPVVIGAFIPNAQQDLTQGCGIRKTIKDRLEAMQVKVERRGEFVELSGEYSYNSTDGSINLTIHVKDSNRKEVASFPETISFRDSPDTVVDIVAPSICFSGKETGRERIERISTPEAPIIIRERIIRASGGQFGISIVVNNATVIAESIDDIALVRIPFGATYKILLENPTEYDTVASISIDGLDVFCFSEEPGNPAGYLVPRGGTQTVEGWFINRNRADSFVLGKFADSAAGQQLGAATDTGAIVIKFRIAWRTDEPTPPGENPNGDPSTRRSKDGTGRGEPIQQDLEAMPRIIGSLREIVSIRYES